MLPNSCTMALKAVAHLGKHIYKIKKKGKKPEWAEILKAYFCIPHWSGRKEGKVKGTERNAEELLCLINSLPNLPRRQEHHSEGCTHKWRHSYHDCPRSPLGVIFIKGLYALPLSDRAIFTTPLSVSLSSENKLVRRAWRGHFSLIKRFCFWILRTMSSLWNLPKLDIRLSKKKQIAKTDLSERSLIVQFSETRLREWKGDHITSDPKITSGGP